MRLAVTTIGADISAATGGSISAAGRAERCHSAAVTLRVDRLPDPGRALAVVRLEGVAVTPETADDPHRHDFHELVWIRSGRGVHLVDGVPLEVGERTITVIARGQVHVFRSAERIVGAVVRVGEEILAGPGGPGPGWLLAARGARAVSVPAEASPRVDGLVQALEAEAARPPDRRTADLERHLVGALLLWVERWYDDARIERPAADDADVQLHRRFAEVLERDYATHHDAAHYAEVLGVPQDALARALGRAAGRSTKELVIDRAILEAARLLRYEDLSVQAVARRLGFVDPFHFSRTFKRRRGESPAAYRARVRGG